MMRVYTAQLWMAMFLLLIVASARAAPPRALGGGFELELIATEPEIVTPVGLAFDGAGRLLVVESHTHQRPDGYDGPGGDRIRMLSDSDGDGKLDRWSTFADGFHHAMNVLVRPDGGVYVICRHKVELLRDTNGDGQADERADVLRLETETDYPHNALSGIALLPGGREILVGLGENFGDYYKLIGRDGRQIEGQGGRGMVFRCTVGGEKLEPFAAGFWNPFSICVAPHGRVFVVDNDPDASPPCRLLHVVLAGDYGHFWQYGRAGTHPLQAWDGELPGTLPMTAGTGEAPTAVLAHRGRLWVTSWGEHRIESYRLVPRGASFSAEREVVVQGDADFRPTGMAIAPNGSLYFGDWVRRDYPVHGHGRIWRLEMPSADLADVFPPQLPHEQVRAPLDDIAIDAALGSDDPFVRVTAVAALSKRDDLENHALRTSPHPKARLGWLEALRWRGIVDPTQILAEAVADESPEVRLYAVRWIADERITTLRDRVAALLEGPQADARYYLAVLAAIDWLDGEPEMRSRDITDELLVRELRNKRRSAEAHTLALRLIAPDHKFLAPARLRRYLAAAHAPLRMEAVRSLALRTDPSRFGLLGAVAGDARQSADVRAEAVAGLAAAAAEYSGLLNILASDDDSEVGGEAKRVLRLANIVPSPAEKKPPAENLAEWVELLAKPGDAEAGRRLFFTAAGARCGVCHQHDGRGGRIGPDLSRIAESSTRERIIASILQPSQEIAPHYQPWVLITDEGKTYTGLRLPKPGDDGIEDYVDAEAKVFSLPSSTIEIREASQTSIMPDGLQDALSIADLRDLVTFLNDSR